MISIHFDVPNFQGINIAPEEGIFIAMWRLHNSSGLPASTAYPLVVHRIGPMQHTAWWLHFFFLEKHRVDYWEGLLGRPCPHV